MPSGFVTPCWMAPQKNLTIATILGSMIWCACTGAPETDGGGNAAGSSGAGSADGSGVPAGDSHVAPVFPTAHPRIYLTPNRARLAAALGASTPAATRFKALVDQWIAGADIWGFESWNAALLGQLTGNTGYCAKAVATVEAQVAAAEAKIAVNQAPAVAGDSYLEIGGMVGDLALVYDWCFNQTTT